MLVFSVGLPQEEYPGYDYAAPQAPGAEDPFAPYENYEGPENTQSGTAEAPDFYIILNTYDDNDNKIQIGRYPISATQIASDLNESVSASLDVSGAGDALSYSYTLGGSSYSGTFDRTGEEILITILSRERKSAEDLVGITLDVSNSTGKTVRITVKNDDPDAPRFVLGTTSGSVTIG